MLREHTGKEALADLIGDEAAGFNDSFPVKLGYYEVEYPIRNLSGRILTIIDASTSGAQNKALKDLIKIEFHKKLSDFQRICSKGNAGHGVRLEAESIDELA